MGIECQGDPEQILQAIEDGRFDDAALSDDGGAASAAADYALSVRAIDEPSPARFNADPARLFEASGSAGKLMVFAVRLDTFACASDSQVFYIGSNDPNELDAIRRRFLADSPVLPVSGEYIHRDAFGITARYGKDIVAAIRSLGTDRLPLLFRVKDFVDRVGHALFGNGHLADQILQRISALLPQFLPERLLDFHKRYEHHLILTVSDAGIDFARHMLTEMFPSTYGDFFACSTQEAEIAMLHRFAVAGAAIRYQAIHRDEVEDIIDIALPRNERHWLEILPPHLEDQLIAKLYYGHFFCHVFHQDYLLKKCCHPGNFEQHCTHCLIQAALNILLNIMLVIIIQRNPRWLTIIISSTRQTR